MQSVDEQPETIHLYVVREEIPRPPLVPIILSGIALSALLALCVFASYQQPELPVTLRGFGFTVVEAHAITCGKNGNYPAYTLNDTLGAGVYIRNLTAFHDGKDSYTIPLQLPKDRQLALDKARIIQGKHLKAGLLAYPCKETVTGSYQLHVVWTCQFFTTNRVRKPP